MERAMTLKPRVGVRRLVLAALMATASLSLASAHGPAEWIERGGYKNAAGELCCGERDCFELADADVSVTARGYFVKSTRETVPYAEALPSPDGRYWRCQWGGVRKCFFAPPGSI
jgi:hypothetical protein